tara:strand:- start:100 stop:1002 length:903 start_codon:yes stop_codon:yes gene_type:complete
MSDGRHTHLAGIIPLANLKTDFELVVPECMLPIDPGFTAIQKAVFECAVAGCQTIWIVANDDLAPIIKKVVGEWIYDPVYYSRKHSMFPSEERKEIPIYYVPIHPKDRDRRDSYGWSALHGVYSAWRVANTISHWVVPHKYFVVFPMSLYNVYSLRKSRAKISDFENNFFLSHGGQTIKDNMPVAFTMFGSDFIQCRRHVNKVTTREYLNPEPSEKYPQTKLPLSERWSARYFELETIFEKINTENSHVLELDWHYDISKWSEYQAFMGSENFIQKPSNSLTKAHTHVKLPYREGEIDDD